MHHISLHILAHMLGFKHTEELCAILVKDDVLVLIHPGYPRYTAELFELLGFLQQHPEYREKLEAYSPIDAEYRDIQNVLLCRCEL